MEGLFFYVFATLATGSALLFVTRRSAIPAAFWLIFCFLNIAALFALLSAHLIAVLQILLYAGAIMVFFLFVVMLLGQSARVHRPAGRPLAMVGAATIAAAALLTIRLLRRAPASALPALPEGFGGVTQVSDVLLTQYVFAFEATGLLLLVAVLGAVVLARRERPKRAAPPARHAPRGMPAADSPAERPPAAAAEHNGAHADSGAGQQEAARV
jgi:NADH-quinone oxidoreductase subunit J